MSYRRFLVPVLLVLALLSTLAPAHAAPVPKPANPSNPLTLGADWQHSTITTAANPEFRSYQKATKVKRKAALGTIALTPRMRWIANCGSCNVKTVRRNVAAYVKDARRVDPDAMVQIAIYGLWPDGQMVRGKRPAISWSMARYQRWIKQIVLGLGDARVAIVLEPDLAISANHRGTKDATTDPTPRTRMKMAAWAAKYLSQALTREAVYIDSGSADWSTVDNAVRLLKASGIAYVRGFALGATHYDSVASNVAYAAKISEALAAAGIPGKQAIIDTADNGTPFTWHQWDARWGDQFRKTRNEYYQFDNTPTCGSFTEQVCQTIGHRPTWDPTDAEAAKLGLGDDQPVLRAQAEKYVDGYLWFGRGWRWMQKAGNDVATIKRSIRMGTYTRFEH